MFWYVLTSCSLFHVVYGFVAINEKMKSFSHAIKCASCHAGEEIELFEHTSGPGVITEQWYTGAGCFDNRTIVRFYVDGDTIPSIEANVFMMHGIGFASKNMPPWGTKWMGHTASDGALYNTYRIPFQKSIRITFVSQAESAKYWYIVRGVENYPVIIGDITLPSNAKLVLHKIEDKIFPPYTYVPLISTEKSGLLFMLTLRGESKNFWYLEGCFGTVITDNNKTDINFLSSGTEDFFLSAYYYNKGIFHTDDSGLTYIQTPGTMSAYKFFHSDPVLIRGKFSLLWRVSERMDSDNCWLKVDEESVKQPGSETEPFPSVTEKLRFLTDTEKDRLKREGLNDGHHPAKITSYVWTYEW